GTGRTTEVAAEGTTVVGSGVVATLTTTKGLTKSKSLIRLLR
uniref:Uncharacterized protein n=1 Tax=Aegilops tauschii subsp. strangulata TaxID=200361 RepID=A0A453CBH9_AEGTS